MAFSGGVPLLVLAALGEGSGAPPPAPQPIRLEFEAPAGCSDAGAFFAAVRARTERVRLAKPGEAALGLRVRLSRAGNKVRGELRVLDASGATDTRKIEGSRCDEVVSVLSLTAALALDRKLSPEAAAPASKSGAADPAAVAPEGTPKAGSPQAAANAEQPATAPPAKRPNSPPPDTLVAREPQSTSVHAVPLQLELGAEAVIAELVVPEVSEGGGIFIRVRRGASGPTLGLSLLHLSNRLFDTQSDLGASFTAASLSACPARWFFGRIFSAEPCAVAMGGRLLVSDRALLNPRSSARSWWGLGAVARGAVSVGGGVTVGLEFGFSAVLVERRFVSRNPDADVAHTPSVSTIGGFSVAYRL